jgi:hypothetical protein
MSILLILLWFGIAAIVGPTGPDRNAWAYYLGGWIILIAVVGLLAGGIAYVAEKKEL